VSDEVLSRITIGLPGNVVAAAHQASADNRVFLSSADKMDFVLALTELNMIQGGGPFGAAIFDDGHRLVAPGVNRVVADSAPIAHAEIVAIAAAAQTVGTWDLAAHGPLSLVTSTEIIGCRDSDARNVGFDEGHKPTDWIDHLDGIGIDVERDIRRSAAADLLDRYVSAGGAIYNGQVGDPSSGE